MVRPLYLEFPQDPAAYTHLDQYLLGEDVLVAPVSIPGKRTTQQVYLPAGRWVDYFTGSTYQGPGTHRVTTTWDTMPVFLREGGILRTLGGQASQGGKNCLRSDKSIVGVWVNGRVLCHSACRIVWRNAGEAVETTFWRRDNL